MDQYYLILDIGMTKTTAALFTKDGEPVKDPAGTPLQAADRFDAIRNTETFSPEGSNSRDYFLVVPSQTKNGAEAVLENTVQAGRKVLEHFGLPQECLLGIGVAAPGPLDARTGVIIDSPMMGVKNFPMARRLSDQFRVPVVMDNDGNLGALAEARCGLGQGRDNILYMTVSTGCGGGAVLGGRVYRGSHNSAAEFGHVSIDPDGPVCPCGNHGCLEMIASGTALRRRMAQDIRSGVKSLAFEPAGYDPEKVQGLYLTQAAEKGDSYALDLYREEGRNLGKAIAIFFNCFDPDLIVLGGGVTKAKQFFHKELMDTLRERAIMPVEDDQVQYSVLNDRVVAYGCYFLISEYLKNGTI